LCGPHALKQCRPIDSVPVLLQMLLDFLVLVHSSDHILVIRAWRFYHRQTPCPASLKTRIKPGLHADETAALVAPGAESVEPRL
jgi:hypothetical protein